MVHRLGEGSTRDRRSRGQLVTSCYPPRFPSCYPPRFPISARFINPDRWVIQQDDSRLTAGDVTRVIVPIVVLSPSSVSLSALSVLRMLSTAGSLATLPRGPTRVWDGECQRYFAFLSPCAVSVPYSYSHPYLKISQ